MSANDDAHAAADELTANSTGRDQAFGISAAVDADGTLTLTNARNGTSRTYQPR